MHSPQLCWTFFRVFLFVSLPLAVTPRYPTIHRNSSSLQHRALGAEMCFREVFYEIRAADVLYLGVILETQIPDRSCSVLSDNKNDEHPYLHQVKRVHQRPSCS